jgi:hypothetical protein
MMPWNVPMRIRWTWVLSHQTTKNSKKKCYFEVAEKIEKCTHVYIMLTRVSFHGKIRLYVT